MRASIGGWLGAVAAAASMIATTTATTTCAAFLAPSARRGAAPLSRRSPSPSSASAAPSSPPSRLSSSPPSWSSDFEEGGDEDSLEFARLYARRAAPDDLSAARTRQFSLGSDLVLSRYLGNMGFEEVTDWEYYLVDEEEDGGGGGPGGARTSSGGARERREVVQPSPFDSSRPRRTRTASGSVVRLFRGELVGSLGGVVGSRGLDRRVLVKEYTGDLALRLASSELAAVGRLQTGLLQRKGDESAKSGEWISVAASRSVKGRVDNANVAELLRWLQPEAFVGILGEVDLAELEDELDANEFYRALGVPPPKAGAVWIVYQYAGLASVQSYASQPPQVRRDSLPPKRGIFGSVVKPPPLPSFEERARYVVHGIMRQSIEAVASLHESGLVHRSIGRGSLILSSRGMDRRQASSPYATLSSAQLVVKLTDFGFAGPYKESADMEDFCSRARSFGLSFRRGEATVASANFAMAEDMHALGFVFLGLLLTALAEVPGRGPGAAGAAPAMPATDEDSLQRLLGDIFDKDFERFREYVEEEEVWDPLVELLGRDGGAGWTVLETLMLAREKAAKTKDGSQLFTIRGLLSNPFFATGAK